VIGQNGRWKAFLLSEHFFRLVLIWSVLSCSVIRRASWQITFTELSNNWLTVRAPADQSSCCPPPTEPASRYWCTRVYIWLGLAVYAHLAVRTERSLLDALFSVVFCRAIQRPPSTLPDCLPGCRWPSVRPGDDQPQLYSAALRCACACVMRFPGNWSTIAGAQLGTRSSTVSLVGVLEVSGRTCELIEPAVKCSNLVLSRRAARDV